MAAQAECDRLLESGDRSERTREFAGRNLLYLCCACPPDQLDRSLAAARRAESIFQTLAGQYPTRFDFAWEISLAQEKIGLRYNAVERWREAIAALEQNCRTLKAVAGRHADLASKMVHIQGRIAAADIKPEVLYLLAVDHARDAGLTGKLPTQLDANQPEKRRRRFVAGAIAMLRQAASDGFEDAARMRKETTFEAIRSDRDFRATMADIEFPAQPFAVR